MTIGTELLITIDCLSTPCFPLSPQFCALFFRVAEQSRVVLAMKTRGLIFTGASVKLDTASLHSHPRHGTQLPTLDKQQSKVSTCSCRARPDSPPPSTPVLNSHPRSFASCSRASFTLSSSTSFSWPSRRSLVRHTLMHGS